MLSDEDESVEEALQNNYSSEMTDEDAVYILAMFSRLRRILHWDLSNDEIVFERGRGGEIIQDLITHFYTWKSFVCTTSNLSDVMGLQHLIIYSLAKLCFYYWIQESSIVAEVLTQVYTCDGHFTAMIEHVINRYEKRPLWPTSDPELREKECLAMFYFLTHAHRAKVTFGGIRYVDLRLRSPLRVPPVFLASIYHKPKLVLLLLRYGALLHPRPQGINDDWDFFMLLRHLTRVLWAYFGTHVQQQSFVHIDTTVISSTLYDAWQCLQVLLRAVRQIEMGELEFSLTHFNQNGFTVSNHSHEFIRWISDKDIVPKLASRYLDPPELQHLCRFTIRNALNSNWNLPYGIFQLPLPKILKHYINLSQD